jgi:hypothetical protein
VSIAGWGSGKGRSRWALPGPLIRPGADQRSRRRSAAVEVSRCPPGSFDRSVSCNQSFTAVEDLLHSLVDPHLGIMRGVADRVRPLGGDRLESHQFPFLALVGALSPGASLDAESMSE